MPQEDWKDMLKKIEFKDQSDLAPDKLPREKDIKSKDVSSFIDNENFKILQTIKDWKKQKIDLVEEGKIIDITDEQINEGIFETSGKIGTGVEGIFSISSYNFPTIYNPKIVNIVGDGFLNEEIYEKALSKLPKLSNWDTDNISYQEITYIPDWHAYEDDFFIRYDKMNDVIRETIPIKGDNLNLPFKNYFKLKRLGDELYVGDLYDINEKKLFSGWKLKNNSSEALKDIAEQYVKLQTFFASIVVIKKQVKNERQEKLNKNVAKNNKIKEAIKENNLSTEQLTELYKLFGEKKKVYGVGVGYLNIWFKKNKIKILKGFKSGYILANWGKDDENFLNQLTGKGSSIEQRKSVFEGLKKKIMNRSINFEDVSLIYEGLNLVGVAKKPKNWNERQCLIWYLKNKNVIDERIEKILEE